jgi:hypothetical protein
MTYSAAAVPGAGADHLCGAVVWAGDLQAALRAGEAGGWLLLTLLPTEFCNLYLYLYLQLAAALHLDNAGRSMLRGNEHACDAV